MTELPAKPMFTNIGGTVSKELPANAEDLRDAGSIPGLGRSLENGMATLSSILAWRNPWTEEPGGLLLRSDIFYVNLNVRN